MRVDIRQDDGGAMVLALDGELTLKTFRMLIEAADGCVEQDSRPERVVLDFGAVSFVDSLGLGALIKIFHSLKRAKIDMVLTHVSDSVMESLVLTRLDQILPIE